MEQIEKNIKTYKCGNFSGYEFFCDVVENSDCVEFWLYEQNNGIKQFTVGLPLYQPAENKTYTYNELLEIGQPCEDDFIQYISDFLTE